MNDGTKRRAGRRGRRWAAMMALGAVATCAAASGGRVVGAPAGQSHGAGLAEHFGFQVGRDLPVGGKLGPIIALAMGLDDTVYAIDGSLGRVLRISRQGKLIGAWGAPGTAPGEFGDGWGKQPDGMTRPRLEWTGPTDLAIGPDGTVYVADPFNGRVQRFTPWGAFVERICVLGQFSDAAGSCAASGTGQPWSVAVGPDGSVFVAVPEQATIRRIQAGVMRAIDGIAAGDLAVDRIGRLYAAEPSAARIVIFDADLQRVDELDGFQYCGGDGGGAPMAPPNPQFNCNPFVVALDSSDRLFVGLGGALAGGTIARRADDGTWQRHAWAQSPSIGGLAVGSDGAMFVGCYYGPERLRAIDAAGGADSSWSVKMPDAKYAPPAQEPGDANFQGPSAVAADGPTVVVSDVGHARLQWLNTEGMPIGGLVGRAGGDALGQPSSALASAPGGGVLAGDASNGLVRHVSRDGTTVRNWGNPGADPARFGADMSAIVRLDDGGFVVSEPANRRLLHFDARGAYSDTWLAGVGYWMALARAPDGTIIAAGSDATNLVRVSQNGRILAILPYGANMGQARGVAVTSDGTILVADAKRGVIARFGADGRWLGAIGDGAKLREPTGVAALDDGRVVVVARGQGGPVDESSRVVTLDADGSVIDAFTPKADGTWGFVATNVQVTDGGTLQLTGSTWRNECPYWSKNGTAVIETDLSGQTIHKWSVPYNGPIGDRCPHSGGAVRTSDGGLLFADTTKRWLYQLAADDTVARVWQTTRSGPGSLEEPSGIAIVTDSTGASKVFVADRVLSRIAGFTWDGAFEREWTSGPNGIPLDGPHQLASAPDGTIWVADTNNHRIAHFNIDGTALGEIGYHGYEPGGLESPEGVAVLRDGTVLVADTGHRRLQAFAPDGTFLAAWSGDGPPGTALRRPAGLSVGDDGMLWVADREADRVVVFGAEAAIGWHVQYYRDNALLDGPIAAQWIPGRHLDLDWHGQPPAPGLGATGFSLRAERRAGGPLMAALSGAGDGSSPSTGSSAGAPAVLRRLTLAVRGGLTFIAPHGQPPVVLAGGPAMATTIVRRALEEDGDWLRVDYAATGALGTAQAGAMVRVGEKLDGVVLLPFAGR